MYNPMYDQLDEASKSRLIALEARFANLHALVKRLSDGYVNNMRDVLYVPQIRAEDFVGGWVSADEVSADIQKAETTIQRLTLEYVAQVVNVIGLPNKS